MRWSCRAAADADWLDFFCRHLAVVREKKETGAFPQDVAGDGTHAQMGRQHQALPPTSRGEKKGRVTEHDEHEAAEFSISSYVFRTIPTEQQQTKPQLRGK